MAFGQSTGSPATARQVAELLTLLNEAGHTDFRDARGPMGFTQRQAGGKFSRDEADAFIEQLQSEAEAGGSGSGGPELPVPSRPPAPRDADPELRRIDTERLAAELRRRGWTVTEP